MIHRVEYLKDILGSNYIGINVPIQIVSPFLDRLKNVLGDEYDVYVKNQQNRDNGHYHITVINVMDYNRLSKEMGIDKFINSLESVFDFDFDDVQFLGLGKAQKQDNKSYFIVVRSEKLQEVRRKYGLSEQDFHVTLGFKWKDVFGVRKNEIIKESEPFLKLLKKSYYNNHETFDFVKEIENFEGDSEQEIEPIEIRETTATFRNGKNDYITVSLIDNEFRITNKYQDFSNKPILSHTLISKKFLDI
jgi:hypothetical protein